MDNNRKSMTELMAEGMNETPSLSRRERRLMEEAAKAKAISSSESRKPDPEEDLEKLSDAIAVDERPTQEYEPVHMKTQRKKAIVLPDEDDDDEDEEEQEEAESSRAKKSKQIPKKKKKPVYDDEDDEDEDEDDEIDDDDIDDDDIDDDDDDDDDYDDDDDDEISVGHRILGIVKVLLAVFLLLILIVLALRIAENAGSINLDPIRNTLDWSFIKTIFPKPIQ